MLHSPPQHSPQNRLVSYFRSGDAMRSRYVSDVLLSGAVDVPAPSGRLVADWQRETSLQLALEPGDVEALSLVRARARWRDYGRCVQAVCDWTATLGLPDVLASADVALMTSRGARYHHDGAQYGASVFCNLFMSDDKGLDLHFPGTGHRIPLVRGTVVIFDTGQPHGLIERGKAGFDAADFPADRDCTQVFLTWELPVEDGDIASALEIEFDIDTAAALQLHEEQVWLNGAPASVCPASGRWIGADLEHFIPVAQYLRLHNAIN